MKLDSRILKGKKPLDCFDEDISKQFIGKKGYVTDFLQDFCNLNKVKVSELKTVLHTELCCYLCGSVGKKYFLPLEWVKEPEKKYREYKDLDEFFDVTGLEIGDLIKLKFPGNNVAELLIVGGCDNGLFIGIHKYTFKQLFEMVEISISGEWQLFGVIQ